MIRRVVVTKRSETLQIMLGLVCRTKVDLGALYWRYARGLSAGTELCSLARLRARPRDDSGKGWVR